MFLIEDFGSSVFLADTGMILGTFTVVVDSLYRLSADRQAYLPSDFGVSSVER